jgi:3-oxoacyl-[acyl-carrier protein] reductase
MPTQGASVLRKGTVIITGAGRGIGLAISQKLAGEGYDLALVDLIPENLQTALESLQGEGEFASFTCDVSSWDSVQKTAQEVEERFDGIYGLVNNAGITQDGLLVRMSPENWERVLAVNLNGTFYFTRCVAPLMMRQRQGRIISMASVIGLTGNAGQANYAASKAGIIAFTKSLARELGSRSVTVNAVAPGFIATDMTARLSEAVKSAMLERIALKRFGMPQDIAEVVTFLLSPESAYITGQTIVCDGGMVF